MTSIITAASIVQLIDYGTRVSKRLHEYPSNAGELPETFKHAPKLLPTLLKILEKAKGAIDDGCVSEDDKSALKPMAEEKLEANKDTGCYN